MLDEAVAIVITFYFPTNDNVRLITNICSVLPSSFMKMIHSSLLRILFPTSFSTDLDLHLVGPRPLIIVQRRCHQFNREKVQ